VLVLRLDTRYALQHHVTERCWQVLARVPHTRTRQNVHSPETFNLWVTAGRILCRHQQQFNISVGWGLLVAPQVSAHRLTANHYRDLSKLPAVRAPSSGTFSRAVQARPAAVTIEVRLFASTGAAVLDETCRGLHWIIWRTFWTLIINFRTHTDTDIFLVLVCGTRTQILSTPLSCTLYIRFWS
jgi:hypothetical protein